MLSAPCAQQFLYGIDMSTDGSAYAYKYLLGSDGVMNSHTYQVAECILPPEDSLHVSVMMHTWC